MALRKDGKNPFPPESDEVTIAKEGEKPAATDKAKPEEKKEEKKKEYIKIDFDGLIDRVTRVPLEADNYRGLVVTRPTPRRRRASRGTPDYSGSRFSAR